MMIVYTDTDSCQAQKIDLTCYNCFMIYTQKIQQAIKFATKTHEVYQKQKRKGKDIPYITHPLTVGMILAAAGASEDIIVAGILHDTIEDSTDEKKVTAEMLKQRFGTNVSNLVRSVTESDKTKSWDERKKEAIEHTKLFSNDSLMLKSADVIANNSEMLEDYRQLGDVAFERFNAPRNKKLNSTIELIDTILNAWPDNPLSEDLKVISQEIKAIA